MTSCSKPARETAETPIYKLLTKAEYTALEQEGVFRGSALDQKDGYIHSSTEDQVEKTRAKFFAHENDVYLLTINPKGLDVRFETSPRSGEIYHHIYESVPRANVIKVEKLA